MARTGRPTFKATDALRRKVERLISCGMSQDDVARAIECSTPTLQKHFPEELRTGAAKQRAEAIELLWKNAKAGNVSAQKHLEAMTRAGAAASALADRELGEAEPDAPAKPIGKKEQQRQAAQKVGGKFSVPDGPKLVVDNNRR